MADKESGSFFGFETTKERNRQSVQVRGVCARGVPGDSGTLAGTDMGPRFTLHERVEEERKTKRFIMNICDINDHISFV